MAGGASSRGSAFGSSAETPAVTPGDAARGDITRSRHSVGDGTSRYIYIVGIKLQDIAITCYNYIKYYIYILLFVTRLSININKHRDIV